MGRATIIRDQRAFALPTVLITSIVMLTVLLAALTAASSISAGLKNQYANQLARTASQSGLTMAKTCMEANNGAITWTQAKPLKPNTDCTGTESVSCPITATSAACYVLKAGNYRTTFRVGVIYDSGNNPTDIDIKGIVREVRKTSGEVVREGTASIKANVQGATSSGGSSAADGSLVVTNGGTCAIADATLYCWGYNGYGQLGIGSTSYGTTPTAVGGALSGKAVTKVSSSFDADPSNLYGHTCAIADGSLYCWGYNGYYQLGNNNTSTQNTPVLIAGGLSGKTVTDVLTYNGGTCAIADGSLYCWGYNAYGQAANGTSNSYITTPTAAVAPLAGKTVTKIAASSSSSPGNLYLHVCAIADGSLYCWGYNGNYQVGNGNTSTQYTPVLVAGGLSGKTVTDVVAYNMGVCAVASSNLYCWGYNGYGQAGAGSSTSYITTPTAVVAPLAGKTVTKVSALNSSSYTQVCAISESNLYCWGYNGNYTVGNGNTTNQTSPVLLTGGLSGKTVTDVTTFDLSTCAVASGSAYCWGSGSYGQIGNGSTGYGTTPTAVTSPLAGKTVTKIMGSGDSSFGSGYGHVCAITDGNNMYCWGYNGYYQVDSSGSTRSSPVSEGVSVLPSGTIPSISINYRTSCAIGSDGGSYCWGYNNYGNFGDNTTNNASAPVAGVQGSIPAGVKLKKISAGRYHTCAVGSDGKAYCWGYNGNYNLGNGSTSQTYNPVAVSQGAIPTGVTLTDISVSYNHSSCAVGSDGKAYCWGYNNLGQLGNNSTSSAPTPVVVSQGAVPTGVTLKSISVGIQHVCAIGSDGKAYCWGYNGDGQLGNGSYTQAYIPVAVSQGTVPTGVNLTKISVGDQHTCAVGSDGKAYCWGYGGYGNLGNSSTSSSITPATVSPGAVPSGVTLDTIGVGYYTSCAVGSNGKAYCWGYNSYGSIGDGSTSQAYTPVAVSQGAVPGDANFKEITVERYHACATASNGKAYCWGTNSYGNLGNNTTSTSYTPVQVLQAAKWGSTASPTSPGSTTGTYLDLTY